MLRTSDGDVKVAIRYIAELDVSESEFISRKKGAIRKLRFGDVELLTK